MKKILSLITAAALMLGTTTAFAQTNELPEAEPVISEAEPTIYEAEPVISEVEPTLSETEPAIFEETNLTVDMKTAEERMTSYDSSSDIYTVGTLNYRESYYDGTMMVVGLADETATNIAITSSVNQKKVTSIEYGAFRDCTKIKSVYIPNTVTNIGNNAFNGCTGLTSVNIPDSVTNIEYDAFYECTGLKSIKISNSITYISNSIFYGCRSLTSVTIPKGVTSIRSDAFNGCSGLTSVTIPNSVTTIEYNAFKGCTGLKSITIPDSVTSIGSEAFSGCSSLTSVTIPDSVTDIGSKAFDGTPFMNNQNTTVKYAGNIVIGCDPNAETAEVRAGTVTIGTYAFSNVENLKSVTLPDGLESIGSDAFSDCSNLTNINIPNTVTNIGSSAFEHCISLKSFTIPKSVTEICYDTFAGCSSLSTLDIPSSITSITDVFKGCSGLTAINVDAGNQNFRSVDGILFDKNMTCIEKYTTGSKAASYTIPKGVTLREYSFQSAKNLTSVTIPKGITNIPPNAFENCTGLTSITFPDGIERIGMLSFGGCTGLEWAYIPKSVTYISTGSFVSSSLKDVYYAGTEEEWSQLTKYGYQFPDGVTVHCNSPAPTTPTVPVSSVTIKTAGVNKTTNMRAVLTQGNKVIADTSIGADGVFSASSIQNGEYTLNFSAKNCATMSCSITVKDGMMNGLESVVELHLFGDINGDGKLTLGDVLKANASARNSKPLTGYDKSVADINEDGKISLGDVLKMNAHARNSKLLW